MNTFVKTLICVGLFSSTVSLSTRASEGDISWEKTETAVLVQSRCSICHSLDYVLMNASFLKTVGWEAEVTKMRKVYGAPVSDEEAKLIVTYLNKRYGVPD